MKFTRAQLRKRGRALFAERLRADDSILAVVIGGLPRAVVDVLEEMCGSAFALGYEAGAQERPIVSDD